LSFGLSIFETFMCHPPKNYYYDVLLWFSFAAAYACIQYLYESFHQAYFWDELTVYFRAAEYLYKHQLSILPNAIPDELSRGHPILLPFVFASAFKLFGAQPLVAHLIAALWSCIGFYFLFLIAKKFCQPIIAYCITLTIFIQPAFISQSILILPEMPLLTMTLAALYFFLNKKYWGCAIFTVLALQIKESAIVLPFVFFLSDTIQNHKISLKSFFQLVLIPILIGFVTYFTLQFFMRGYFFYPLHAKLLSFDTYFIRERWNDFSNYIISQPAHLLVLLLLCIAFVRIPKVKSPLNVFPILLLAGLGFLILNYYLSRYTLYFIGPVYLYSLLQFNKISQSKPFLIYVVCFLIASLGVYKWETNQYTDVDFTPYYHIKNMKQGISYLNQDQFNDKSVFIGFPMTVCYWNDNNGYNAKNNFEMELDLKQNSDYKVFTYPGNMSDTLILKPSDTLITELRCGYAYSRIYKTSQPEQH
jgi:hypothetical protein